VIHRSDSPADSPFNPTKETARMKGFRFLTRIFALLFNVRPFAGACGPAGQGSVEAAAVRTRRSVIRTSSARHIGGRFACRALMIVGVVALVTSAVLTAAPAEAAAAGPAISIHALASPTHFTPAANDAQELAVDAVGGSFTLTYYTSYKGPFAGSSETTSPIPYDASASDIKASLEELPFLAPRTNGGQIGPENIEVTGPAGGPFIITFTGSLAHRPTLPMSVDASALQGSDATATVTTKVPGANGVGNITLLLRNVGSEPTGSEPIVVTDELPAGVNVRSAPGCSAVGSTVTCTIASPGWLPADGEAPNEFVITLNVEPGASGKAFDTAEVSGGGARTAATTIPVEFAPPAVPFGFSSGEFEYLDDEGNPDTQAGSHPNLVDFGFDLNNQESFIFAGEDSSQGEPHRGYFPPQSLKDVVVELPLGLVGNPQSVAEACTPLLVLTPRRCPAGSHLGVPALATGFETFGSNSGSLSANEVPITNTVPEPGTADEFIISDGGVPAANESTIVRTAAGYVIRTAVSGIPAVAEIRSVFLSFWGDPDTVNGVGPAAPFFTTPADCSGPAPTVTIHADSWQDPAPLAINPGGSTNFNSANFEDPQWATETVAEPTPTGCNKLQFEASLEARPSTNLADSPSGLDVDLKVPQNEEPEELATPPLKDSVITLPKGIAVNPSSADGLQGCSPAQIVVASSEPGNCPSASKLGEVELETPLLDHILHGAVYLGTPECAPCSNVDAQNGKLMKLYIEIDDPSSGTVLKLPGAVSADPGTGQLTATFDNNPQQPFTSLKIRFKEGNRAPLTTPATCGAYETTSSLTPWSAPESGPPATPADRYSISGGPNGQACASSEAQLPDKPSFSAGTTSTQAGAYSPFVLKLSREDGSQRLTNLDVTLPPGLIGRLAGVAYCPEAAIKAAESSSGAAEKMSPSCPASSELGTVDVASGSGPTPFHVQGHVYLTGPYKGAPLSMAIVTPAVAGPFDLGTVVVRSALYVDPLTTQITVKSDPIPTMLAGIPLDVRSISVSISRNRFTLNPTSCEKMSLTGDAGTTAGQSIGLSSPFQVGGCKSLGFKPKLNISLKGSTHRAGHPALKAVLTMPAGGANIARAQVGLPGSEFLDQGNLNKVCTQGELNSQSCPTSSVYGHAEAWSPLLEAPLEGPVYLGVGFGYKLPALVAELDGQIRVLLVGKVDTDKEKGIRNTFEVVPDAPVSRFELTLKGGPRYGLLENSEDICRKAQKANVSFTAQSGRVDQFRPTIANSCKKKGKAKRHGKRGAGHRRPR
jgi:hypothetical protein